MKTKVKNSVKNGSGIGPLFNVSVYRPFEKLCEPYHIYFYDIKSLKHWLVSMDEEYFKQHDIIITYE